MNWSFCLYGLPHIGTCRRKDPMTSGNQPNTIQIEEREEEEEMQCIKGSTSQLSKQMEKRPFLSMKMLSSPALSVYGMQSNATYGVACRSEEFNLN